MLQIIEDRLKRIEIKLDVIIDHIHYRHPSYDIKSKVTNTVVELDSIKKKKLNNIKDDII